jgi:hypothetical protein
MYVLGASCLQLNIAVVFILSLCMKLVVGVSDSLYCRTGVGGDSWPLVAQLMLKLFLFYWFVYVRN